MKDAPTHAQQVLEPHLSDQRICVPSEPNAKRVIDPQKCAICGRMHQTAGSLLERRERLEGRRCVAQESMPSLCQKRIHRCGDWTWRTQVWAVSHVVDDRECAARDLAVHVFP